MIENRPQQLHYVDYMDGVEIRLFSLIFEPAMKGIIGKLRLRKHTDGHHLDTYLETL